MMSISDAPIPKDNTLRGKNSDPEPQKTGDTMESGKKLNMGEPGRTRKVKEFLPLILSIVLREHPLGHLH
jgi:hypothetical protein